MMQEALIQPIRTAAAALLAAFDLPWPAELQITVEQPARPAHGDYATNLAMQLARHLRRAPLQIARELADRLPPSPWIDRAEVAAPGFLNLWINWAHWAAHGSQAPPPAGTGGKVVVEHTSINPNKAAHVGHLRNACIGDTLARLLRRRGQTVEVHNYIDDLGNQVADTVLGLLHLPLQGDYRRFGDFCWDLYAQVHQQGEALTAQRSDALHALEAGDGNLAWLGALVAERIVAEHVDEMGAFGIRYDLLVWESHIVRGGFWDAAFALLQRSPLFVKEEEGRLAGCWVLKEPSGAGAPDEFGAEKVLVRSNGVLTYTAKDIAYHLWKFGLLEQAFRYRRFAQALWTTAPVGATKRFGRASRVLNVIDKRQEYPQAMVQLALQTLGFAEAAANLHHVSYGVVSLSPATAAQLGVEIAEGKASYPMSGRQGIGIKMSDLLDQMEAAIERQRARRSGLSSRAIAAAAIRYYLLRYHLATEIVFDMEGALDLKGNTGPYVMYAHARAASILRRAGAAEAPAPDLGHPSPVEGALLRQLAAWPDTLAQAAEALLPSTLTNYAYELATRYNQFYEAAPVLYAPEADRQRRLWLTALVKERLADVLGVLGLPAPERM